MDLERPPCTNIVKRECMRVLPHLDSSPPEYARPEDVQARFTPDGQILIATNDYHVCITILYPFGEIDEIR